MSVEAEVRAGRVERGPKPDHAHRPRPEPHVHPHELSSSPPSTSPVRDSVSNPKRLLPLAIASLMAHQSPLHPTTPTPIFFFLNNTPPPNLYPFPLPHSFPF